MVFWCVTPYLPCVGLKRIECIQNVVWHSYQALSMEMNVSSDSRIRVHSVVQRPAGPGSPRPSWTLHKHLSIHIKRSAETTHHFSLWGICWALFVFQTSLKQQVNSSFGKLCTHIQWVFFMIHSKVLCCFFLPAFHSCNEKKKPAQRNDLSRWKWEFEIVSYRRHLFAGDMLIGVCEPLLQVSGIDGLAVAVKIDKNSLIPQ